MADPNIEETGLPVKQVIEHREAEAEDWRDLNGHELVNESFTPPRRSLMPTVAEAKARLAEIERERDQLRAFIRNEERIAKKHPTGHLKGME